MGNCVVICASCLRGQQNNTAGNEKSRILGKKCLTKVKQCVNITALLTERRTKAISSKKFGKT